MFTATVQLPSPTDFPRLLITDEAGEFLPKGAVIEIKLSEDGGIIIDAWDATGEDVWETMAIHFDDLYAGHPEEGEEYA